MSFTIAYNVRLIDQFTSDSKKIERAAKRLNKAMAKNADFHIGIVTGTVSQSEDDLRGAQALIAEYGDVKDGGMIKHLHERREVTGRQPPNG